MRENLLRSQVQNRKKNKVATNPEKQTGQDEGPKNTQDELVGLTEQISRIIPKSRIDTAAAIDDLEKVTKELTNLKEQISQANAQSKVNTTAEGLTGNLPTEVHPAEDLRNRLNERNGVVEVEITHDNLDTAAADLVQPDPEDDLRRALKARRRSGVGPCVTRENLTTALAKATSRLLTDEQREILRLDMVRRLRDKIDGIESTDTDSDTQGEHGQETGHQRKSNTTLNKLAKVLDDIKRRKEEKRAREEGKNPINPVNNPQLADQEDGELTDEDMINVVDHSDYDDSPRTSRDRMKQSSPRFPNHKDLVMPSPYRILTNNPTTVPITPPRQARFPAAGEAQLNHLQAKIDLYVQKREAQDRLRTANPAPNSPLVNQQVNQQENVPRSDCHQSPGMDGTMTMSAQIPTMPN